MVCRPTAQTVHTPDVLAEAAVLYAPAEQAVHTAASVAPTTKLYAPAAHPVQAPQAASVEYLPAGQAAQADAPVDSPV